MLQFMQPMICAALLAGLDDMQPINIDAVGFDLRYWGLCFVVHVYVHVATWIWEWY